MDKGGNNMAKNQGNLIGGWAFLIGIILAIVLGLIGSLNQQLVFVLVVVGLIVGLLNVADEEVTPFLMSGAVLVIVSAFGQEVVSTVPRLASVLQALLVIFVPATIIVAIRNVFSIARR